MSFMAQSNSSMRGQEAFSHGITFEVLQVASVAEKGASW